ncbi:translation initiation factor IF-2-like isoform X3 [Xenopus laevis]|uniref:1-alkyl-2-acetylglycerophosphocholine esterase n=1 Tax=Xenopus laevis TaxID=8355 RepID=A0A8J1M924_XENLA|nr:translation initiation factor IF-2-like isoform X3 [Xenopus laevis]
MAALKELLARIRAQASEQGDDWVRQQLAAQPAPTARQAASRRRTRPPERLSPAVSSRSSQRRRMRSPSPPVAGPGSSVGASAADRRGTGKKQQGGRMPCRGQGAGRRSRAGMRLGAGSQDGADRSPVVRGGATAGSSPGRSRRESAARRGSSSSRGETTQAGQRQTDRRSTDRESERRQREPAAQRGGHGGRAATSGTDLAGEPGGSSRVSMAAPPAGGDRDGGGFSRCLSPQGAAQRSGGPQQGREGSTSRHREEDRGAASSVTGCAGGRGGPPPANMGAPSVGGCWAGGVSSLLLPLQGSSGQDWSSGLGTAGEAPGTSDGSSGHRATATTDSIMEALRTAPASGPSGSRRCMVWVMGHSYIFWAEQRAGLREKGRRFWLPADAVEVQWHGKRGLSWLQIRAWIEDKFRQEGPPDVLVLHAGGNDVGKIPMRDLIGRMKQDLVRIRAMAPRLVVIWSQIVPRLVWRGARDLKAVQRTRAKINAAMTKFVHKAGGIVVRHVMLERDPKYYRPDGVHLNGLGLEVFNYGLREGVEVAIQVWRGMRD